MGIGRLRVGRRASASWPMRHGARRGGGGGGGGGRGRGGEAGDGGLACTGRQAGTHARTHTRNPSPDRERDRGWSARQGSPFREPRIGGRRSSRVAYAKARQAGQAGAGCLAAWLLGLPRGDLSGRGERGRGEVVGSGEGERRERGNGMEARIVHGDPLWPRVGFEQAPWNSLRQRRVRPGEKNGK